MSALQPRDRVQILAGLHAGKPGTVHSLDGEGYWVLPDGVSTPALYEEYELAEEDDGTEAEALAVVETPRWAASADDRVQAVEPKHPRFGQQGVVARTEPDSLGRVRVVFDGDNGWTAVEAWCLAPVSRFLAQVDADYSTAGLPDIVLLDQPRATEPGTEPGTARWSQAGYASVRWSR